MKFFRVILFSALLFSAYRTQGQTRDLKQKLFSYSHEHPSTNLYIHMDKNFYLPGETIWFKAYLLSRIQYPSKSLYVRIINEKKQPVMKEEFLVHDIRAEGDLTLPDTLPEGNYQFYAFTDNMINFNPGDAFVQPFKVSLTGNQLSVEASVLNTHSLHPGRELQIICHLKANGTGVSKARGTYRIRI